MPNRFIDSFHFVDNSKEADKLSEISDKITHKKTLPDLDRYWKAVNDDPSDFTAWTYLLQYVEQEVIFVNYKISTEYYQSSSAIQIQKTLPFFSFLFLLYISL